MVPLRYSQSAPRQRHGWLYWFILAVAGQSPVSADVLPLRPGVYPTVVTPWCDRGVDETALAREIQYQLAGGVHGLLILGTLGEGELASEHERAQTIQVAVRQASGRVPVVVGIHTCRLETALTQAQQAQQLGADALLVKYIGKPCACFAEVYDFYARLAAAQTLPLLYYHYPAETGLRLTAPEIAAILQIPNIVGIKETSLDLQAVQVHLAGNKPLLAFSGTALNLTQFLERGGHGAMCPEAALLPHYTADAFAQYQAGNYTAARRRQRQLFVVAPLWQDRPSSPLATRLVLLPAQDHCLALPLRVTYPQARMKATLDALAVPMSATVKPPLPPLDPWDRLKVRLAVARISRLED